MWKHSKQKEYHDESPCAHQPTSTIKTIKIAKHPRSILFSAGAPSDREGKEKASPFTISFGTLGPNSLFGPNICFHPSSSSLVTYEERDLGRKRGRTLHWIGQNESPCCTFCPGDLRRPVYLLLLAVGESALKPHTLVSWTRLLWAPEDWVSVNSSHQLLCFISGTTKMRHFYLGSNWAKKWKAGTQTWRQGNTTWQSF